MENCVFADVKPPLFSLENQVCVVLAGTSGIGKAIVKEMVRCRANVLVLGRREEFCKRLAEECTAEFQYAPEYVIGDLRDPSTPATAVKTAVSRWGKVSVLINNCGGPKTGSFESTSDSDWEEAFQSIFMSYVRAIRACIPVFHQQRYGRVVNIASVSTKVAIPNLVLSNAFRMAVVGLAKTLAAELGRDGILVNSISPGKIDTGRTQGLDQLQAKTLNMPFEDLRRKVYQEIPLGRYGTPEEAALLAVFLCSPANTYLSGQNIVLDGGLVQAY